MITPSRPVRNTPEWKRQLTDAVSDPAELVQLLELDPALLPIIHRSAKLFGLRVPRGFICRIRRGDVNDPLLRQVLPLDDELTTNSRFTKDPVGDLQAMSSPGIINKYSGRALLIATGACAVHCRYCFRRHFPYSHAHASAHGWQTAIGQLERDSSINEVILSGGDPLSLSNRKLEGLVEQLQLIPHIKRLRIHTRLPIMIPERIDESLIYWLQNCPLQKVVVLHINHANEIDISVKNAMHRLKSAGVTLFNQSVLLRGVNDNFNALRNLSEALFEVGVTPYYLHLLDRVEGATHFEVPQAHALSLIDKLKSNLPGYLVPRLVWEESGAPSKTHLA